MAEELDLTPDPMFAAGTWANWTRVILGREEVTIDFAIQDPVEPGSGTLMVRVTLPPGAAYELRDQLVRAMQEYNERGQPPLG